MRRNEAKRMALGGMLAAVAVVIMALGGLIPVATYICPMLCSLTLFLVYRFCGKRIAWCWYGVVSFLSMLMSADKEAVMVFAAIGYYPLIKFQMDKLRLSGLLKTAFFNLSVFAAYGILIYILGMQEIAAENMELGLAGLVIILLLGNITFFLLDRLLNILSGKLR